MQFTQRFRIHWSSHAMSFLTHTHTLTPQSPHPIVCPDILPIHALGLHALCLVIITFNHQQSVKVIFGVSCFGPHLIFADQNYKIPKLSKVKNPPPPPPPKNFFIPGWEKDISVFPLSTIFNTIFIAGLVDHLWKTTALPWAILCIKQGQSLS